MADYKDMITGTLKNIMGKVKEVADSNTVRDIYEQGAGKAKSYGQIAKLALEINGDREELKRVFAEIGQLYYEQAKDAPEGFFRALFAQAEQIKANISAKEEEISYLKSEVSPTAADIDVEIAEFEEVVSDTAADGAGEAPTDENI
ncbi:MAG: hypothetical protein IJB09_02825 [Oscillospiraceae bacterium]|nr:hypothetical protein [Oscillospiraceae bacterium]